MNYYIPILSDSLVDRKNRPAAWKSSLESHGLLVNVSKTKTLISNAEHETISVTNTKYPCGACTFHVGATSILRTLCDLWIRNKFQVKLIALLTTKTLHAINVPEFKLYIVPAGIASHNAVRLSELKFHW